MNNKDALLSQEIPKVLGALCQELGTETSKYSKFPITTQDQISMDLSMPQCPCWHNRAAGVRTLLGHLKGIF